MANKTVQFDNNTPNHSSPPPPARGLVRSDPQERSHVDLATGQTTTLSKSIQQVRGSTANSKWKKLLKSTRKLIVDESDDVKEDKVYRIRTICKVRGDRGWNVSEISLLSEYLRWTFRATFFEVFLATYGFFLFLIILFAICIYGVGRYQPHCITTARGDFLEAGTMFMDAFHLSWTTLSTVGYGAIYPTLPDDATDTQCYGINALMAGESFVGVLFGGITAAIIIGKIARIQSIAQVQFSAPAVIRYGTGVMLPTDHENEEEDVKVDNKEAEPKLELPCPVLEFRLANLLSLHKGGEIMNASISVVATTLKEMDEVDPDLQPSKPTSSPLASNLVGTASSLTKGAKKVGTTTASAAFKVGSAGANAAMKVGTVGACAAKKVGKTTGAALFGASKVTAQATGSMLQRLNYSLSRQGSPRDISTMLNNQDSSTSNSIASDEPKPFSQDELERELQKEVELRLSNKLKAEEARIADAIEALKGEKGPTSVAVDEGDSQLSPCRIFHKLELEADAHPFFKRVWNIRHRLDENSPLLSRRARRMIQDNRGFWPEELNNHEAVRKHVNFSEIICNFSGTANASGSTVFCQKIYDYVDVNVGYALVPMLCSTQGNLVVDYALINDVVEQIGGGAEPFQHSVMMEEMAALPLPERAGLTTFYSAESCMPDMPCDTLKDQIDVHEPIREVLSLETDLEAGDDGEKKVE